MLRTFLSNTIGYHAGIPVEALREKYSTEGCAFLRIQGMDLHYRVTGSGPALLLLHGVASSLHTWDQWHRLLSDSFTVISMDVPGFGLTGPHPENDYSIRMYVQVINGLLDHLKHKRVYMAGNSFGGFLTWNYAIEEPGRVHRILIQDAAGLNSHHRDISDVGFMLATFDTTRKITYRVTPRSLIRSSIRNATTPQFMITEEIIDRYFELLLRKGNRKAFSEILRNLIFTGKDNTDRIRKVRIPTLIQWGEKDNLVDIGYGYLFHRAIDGSELVSYPNTGHLPMEEIPERSAMDAKQFFQNT